MSTDKPHRIPLNTMNAAALSAAPPGTPEPPPAPLGRELTPAEAEELRTRVVEALKTCYDPEIPVNIYELGLIYDIAVTPAGAVGLRMTLTSPACPVAGSLPPEVQAKVQALANVTAAKVDLVWDPPWDPSRMSDAARLKLGIDW